MELKTIAIEKPAEAQGLIAVADKYEQLGQVALAENSWQDSKLRGIQKAVRDIAGETPWSDDFGVAHDVGSPI